MFEPAFSSIPSSAKRAAVMLGGLLCLVACESREDATDGDATDGDSASAGATASPTDSESTGSTFETRLAQCPVLSLSSDPSAGACLAGTYDGKTPSDEACSLELGELGAYEFTSPSLVVSHTAPDKTIFVFDHTVVGDYELIAWKVSDPIAVETWYELNFEARFGAGVPEADSKIQIEVTEHGETATKSVVCVVEL